MISPKEKADELIRKYSTELPYYTKKDNTRKAINCSIVCCKEVLGYMGADRGYEFWTSVLYELEHYE